LKGTTSACPKGNHEGTSKLATQAALEVVLVISLLDEAFDGDVMGEGITPRLVPIPDGMLTFHPPANDGSKEASDFVEGPKGGCVESAPHTGAKREAQAATRIVVRAESLELLYSGRGSPGVNSSLVRGGLEEVAGASLRRSENASEGT
jgi:hypothetical protein